MALTDIADMTNSGSLRSRLFAAATQAGQDSTWLNSNVSQILGTESWADAWIQARTAPDASNWNPDTGIRTDVITDDMITTAVQALITAAPGA